MGMHKHTLIYYEGNLVLLLEVGYDSIIGIISSFSPSHNIVSLIAGGLLPFYQKMSFSGWQV